MILKLCFTIYNIYVLLGIRYGTGMHLYDLTPEDATTALKVRY